MEIGHFYSTRRQYYSLFPYRNPENVISLPYSRWIHTAAAHMNESGMSEIVDTGNQQSNKEVDWQKVFYVFGKYIRFVSKGTKIQNSILYIKYVF